MVSQRSLYKPCADNCNKASLKWMGLFLCVWVEFKKSYLNAELIMSEVPFVTCDLYLMRTRILGVVRWQNLYVAFVSEFVIIFYLNYMCLHIICDRIFM